MKESRFEQRIQKRIQQLPKFEPKQDIWENIQSRLSFEKHLKKTLDSLPNSQPKNELWMTIAKSLDNNVVRDKSEVSKSLLFYMTAVAASIAILIGFYFKTNLKPDITITEEIATIENNIDFQWNVPEPIEYINEQCKKQNSICNDPEFIENKKQLEELDKELRNLKKVINRYGESPELIKSVIIIENLKTEIILELMNSLNS